jgi:hypothetical protein
MDLEQRLRADLAEPPVRKSRPQHRGVGGLLMLAAAVALMALTIGSVSYISTLRASSSAVSTASTSPTVPSPMPTPPPTGPLANAPTETPLPAQALIVGQVVEQGTFHPVAGALVHLDPYALDATTDAQGSFTFRGLAVPGRCRWVTLTVTAPGYGRLRTIDNPLYPLRALFQLFLEPRDADHYMGAPQGATPSGEAFCSR